jgi:hypothetical protein
VLRELRAHVEDFVIAARQNGRSEEEIEGLLLERFGDPGEIAQQFAWVYRRERAAAYFGRFVLSTVVVSVVMSAAAISMHAGIMFGFGLPVNIAFGSRHSAFVAFDVLASVAAYLGLISLSRFVHRPLAVLAAVVTAMVAVFAATGLPQQFILFGFANGALLRGIESTISKRALRIGATVGCFGVLSTIFLHSSQAALMTTAASWLTMGAAYHLMTHVAARVDGALLGRL